MDSFLFQGKYIPKLIYRGSVDGTKKDEFMSKVSARAPTLHILRSDKDKVFGAYISVTLGTEKNSWEDDSEAFIFSVSNKTKHIQYRNRGFAVYRNKSTILLCMGYESPGNGFDLCIHQSYNFGNSNSSLGQTYALPPGVHANTEQAKEYLAGASKFSI